MSITSNNGIVRVGAMDSVGNYPASVLAGADGMYTPPGNQDGTGPPQASDPPAASPSG